MSKIIILSVLIILIFTTACFASKIRKITITELYEKADLIVIAEVIKLVEDKDQDHVTIKIAKFLKGNSTQTIFNFTLVTRGGLKDFDPSLILGDVGVFFLKQKEDGEVKKAYWGSIAIFQKNHFYLAEKSSVKPTTINFSTLLDAWSSYRIDNKLIKKYEEYERGFREGFSNSPGLVDGSADFNLGHSDGMTAKMMKFPDR